MAKYTVIADLSRSLKNMIVDNVVPEIVEDSEDIVICDPSDIENFPLGIHLYCVKESKEAQLSLPMNLLDGKTKDPPTAYEVSYMISTNLKSDTKDKSCMEQEIIGRLLQLFKDNRVLQEKYMPESLKSVNEKIYIELLTLDVDERVKIWKMFNSDYKLSVFLVLRPVFIESRNTRVPNKRITSVEIKDDPI